MDFGFTPEQEAFREAVAAFADAELKPYSARWDREGRFPRDVVSKMASMGLIGLGLDSRWGGEGADCVTSGIAAEVVAAADLSASYFMLIPLLVAEIIQAGGSERQCATWIPPIASGQRIAALCLTEPEAGSDASSIGLRAEDKGCEYVLYGEKTSISLGEQADDGLVFARCPEGVTALYVDLSSAGVSRQVFEDLGGRAVGRAALAFDGVAVPKANVVGRSGKGLRLVLGGFDYTRSLIGLQCLAVARAAINEAVAYTKERETFGRPVITNQGVAFPLVEHLTYIEACRLLAFKALWLKDCGRPHTAEASMVKWWAPRLSADAVHQALLFHGHLGYCEELPLAQRLRDVIGLEIGDGTAEIAKAVVARELFGRDFKPY